MTLTPAYGRDYKSQKAVEEDFNLDKDFIINDIMSPWNGKPCNKSSLGKGEIVQIRYAKLRKIMVIKIK
jgi:hypothetical protein